MLTCKDILKFPTINSKGLKNKYPNLSLTHFWEYKIKTNANAGQFLMGEWFDRSILKSTTTK